MRGRNDLILSMRIRPVLDQKLTYACVAIPGRFVQRGSARLHPHVMSTRVTDSQTHPVCEVHISLSLDELGTRLCVTTLGCLRSVMRIQSLHDAGGAADPVERSAAVLWNTGINRSTDTLQLADDCVRIASLEITRC